LLFSVPVKFTFAQSSRSALQALVWLSALLLMSIGFFQIENRASRSPASIDQPVSRHASVAAVGQALPSVIRTYDVHDLIDRWESSRFLSGREPSNRLFTGRAPGAIFATTPSTPKDLLYELVRLVEDQASPSADSDGDHAIWTAGRTIIAYVPPDMHEKISAVLHQLRRADAEFP